MDTQQRRRRLARCGAAGAAVGAMAILVVASGPAAGDGWSGRAVLRDVAGTKVGTVRFEGDEHGTAVKVIVSGITAGVDSFHGLHVHANPDGVVCDPAVAFASVLGHWNPSGAPHGQHAGDLPSLLVQLDGTGTARSVTGRLDPAVLAGKAVILHAAPDNFANIPAARYSTPIAPGVVPDATTTATGDSGGRIACGIIDAG